MHTNGKMHIGEEVKCHLSFCHSFHASAKQLCIIITTTITSTTTTIIIIIKNYQNMHKSAKLCIQMQKYAHKCKNAN